MKGFSKGKLNPEMVLASTGMSKDIPQSIDALQNVMRKYMHQKKEDIDWWLRKANEYDFKKKNQQFVGILKKESCPPKFIKANIDDFGNAELVTPNVKPYLKFNDLFKEKL